MLTVEPSGTIDVVVTWSPEAEGRVRETLLLKWEGKGRLQIVLTGSVPEAAAAKPGFKVTCTAQRVLSSARYSRGCVAVRPSTHTPTACNSLPRAPRPQAKGTKGGRRPGAELKPSAANARQRAAAMRREAAKKPEPSKAKARAAPKPKAAAASTLKKTTSKPRGLGRTTSHPATLKPTSSHPGTGKLKRTTSHQVGTKPAAAKAQPRLNLRKKDTQLALAAKQRSQKGRKIFNYDDESWIEKQEACFTKWLDFLLGSTTLEQQEQQQGAAAATGTLSSVDLELNKLQLQRKAFRIVMRPETQACMNKMLGELRCVVRLPMHNSHSPPPPPVPPVQTFLILELQ